MSADGLGIIPGCCVRRGFCRPFGADRRRGYSHQGLAPLATHRCPVGARGDVSLPASVPRWGTGVRWGTRNRKETFRESMRANRIDP